MVTRTLSVLPLPLGWELQRHLLMLVSNCHCKVLIHVRVVLVIVTAGIFPLLWLSTVKKMKQDAYALDRQSYPCPTKASHCLLWPTYIAPWHSDFPCYRSVTHAWGLRVWIRATLLPHRQAPDRHLPSLSPSFLPPSFSPSYCVRFNF